MDTRQREISLEPSVVKSCSRCRARKVKCDLKLPQCSACIRHDEQCNITEYVAYPYSTIEALLGRIQTLEAQVQTAGVTPSQGYTNAGSGLSQPVENQEGLAKEAEEIGILAVGGPSSLSTGTYVGSASGSTFARIFFKQLSLCSGDLLRSTGSHQSSADRGHATRQASLPPQSVAKQYFEEYVVRVHVWWPFLALPFLRSVFEQVYKDPQQCGDYEKFLVFAVLALASRSAAAIGVHTLDLNTPESYFQSCLNFFSGFREVALARRLASVHPALLIALWLMDTEGLGELWHLSRHAMSSAIEAGLHRYNADWKFEEKEAEVRNRTWWCVYNLERQAATMTGRVLSIRDHAIEVPLPVYNASLDHIPPRSHTSTGAAQERILSVESFRCLIELRRFSGRILESVYVRRHRSQVTNTGAFQDAAHVNGNVNTSFEQICAEAEAIGLELSAWEQRLDPLLLQARGSGTSTGGGQEEIHAQYVRELRIECCLLQLLLYRPSPVFMVPSTQMVLASGRAAKTAIEQYIALDELRAGNGTSVCTSVRHLHRILLAGLAGVYCDWRTMQAYPDSNRLQSGYTWLETHTQTCLGIIERGVSHLGRDSFDLYVRLFRAVRIKVYSENFGTVHEESFPSAGMTFPRPEQLQGVEGGMPFLGEDVDSYLGQVGTILEDGTFGLDETLTEWYNALMEGTGAFSPPTRAEDM